MDYPDLPVCKLDIQSLPGVSRHIKSYTKAA